MSAGRFRPLRWFDGLRGRIAAALLIGLVVQFIGSDIIFERIEAERMERGRAQRLADWLTFADEFAATRPDAVERMTRLWQPDLVVLRSPGPPPGFPSPHDSVDARVEQLVLEGRPHLRGHDLHAVRQGQDLKGWMQLCDGGWLTFTSKGYFAFRSQIHRYAASALLLLLCVAIIVLLLSRMIGRPLAKIAEAAEHVGHNEPVPIAVDGPREVRQVAAAFDRMQTRLLAQIRDRLQSMAAMSHDLRTPLARMRLNASAVEDADTRAALEQDVEEMERFVSSILDYLRGDEAEAEQRVDIASIVMTVVDEARDAGDDAAYAGPHRLETTTRPLKLKRLVRNIVQNATRHAGNADVTLEESDDGIRICVRDDGPGLPDEQMAMAFEPFYRLETSRNRGTGGSGLGLAIARRLADQLGGSVLLANRPGGGLKVTIFLPLG